MNVQNPPADTIRVSLQRRLLAVVEMTYQDRVVDTSGLTPRRGC